MAHRRGNREGPARRGTGREGKGSLVYAYLQVAPTEDEPLLVDQLRICIFFVELFLFLNEYDFKQTIHLLIHPLHDLTNGSPFSITPQEIC